MCSIANIEQSAEVSGEAKGVERVSDHSESLDKQFTREEVRLRTKEPEAPGRDGLTAEMVGREVLVDSWWKLANLRWRHDMLPSMRRKGVVMSVPKKKGRGVCEVDNFHGKALASVVYKAMCSVVPERLVQIVEPEHLLAEEQGGLRRRRGCRDQILTMTILRKLTMMTRKRRMFAAFITWALYNRAKHRVRGLKVSRLRWFSI